MKLIELYRRVIKQGIEHDPRSRRQIQEDLVRAKGEFRKLKGVDAKVYDRERLTNPYADTRILYGDPKKDIRAIMVGIDMESPEILTADSLNKRGTAIDLVMTHHPEGAAWAGLDGVMHLQARSFEKLGVPLEVGKDLLKERIEEVQRALAPANHARSVDVARLLDIPFMCVHTPADNHVAGYLQKLFDTKKPKKLSQVLSLLKHIPEYTDALRKNAGPKILIGDPSKDAGKIFVDMTGGTEGPKKIYPRLSQAGVGTIVAMHLSEEHFKYIKGEHINVVIAGHIASDTLGMNLVLDGLERVERFTILPCSGFMRVKR